LSSLNLGVACWLQGEVVAASEAFLQAGALGQTTGNTYVELMAAAGLTQVRMVQGRRHLAFEAGRLAVALAAEGVERLLPAAAYAYAGMGQLLYERDELEAAAGQVREAVACGERWHNGDVLVYACTVLAQIEQARGDIARACALMERAAGYLRAQPQTSWMAAIMVASPSTPPIRHSSRSPTM
jgi:LuxR family maltose regulon positive regulatory protein